jgi:hypothetical protein
MDNLLDACDMEEELWGGEFKEACWVEKRAPGSVIYSFGPHVIEYYINDRMSRKFQLFSPIIIVDL